MTDFTKGKMAIIFHKPVEVSKILILTFISIMFHVILESFLSPYHK